MQRTTRRAPRIAVLAAFAISACVHHKARNADDDYVDRPLREQVAGIESGATTSVRLLEAYVSRVEARDRGAEATHAVIALDPEARSSATSSDSSSQGRRPLRGVPILVKDNIDTRGVATTAGSLALARNVARHDARVVERIRSAGGVILGKTNLSEWANFRGDRSTSGWSSLGGQTFNGRVPRRSPCGSSSGSAAAVAAGFASAALGTETVGSVVCPASMNGVVGFKPTVGLVSRAGVVPISASQDTVGTITHTVGDAARLLGVIAGADPNDPATLSIPEGMNLDFEAAVANATLRGKRLGVVDFGFGPAVKHAFAVQRARLEAAGATLVDVNLGPVDWKDEMTILLHEFKIGINRYLAAHPVPGQPRTLEELIAFNEANAGTVLVRFGQELFMRAQETTGLSATEYVRARAAARSAAGPNGIDAVLAAHRLDALISPTASPAWTVSPSEGDPELPDASAPAAVAGYPHLTVPMGLVEGLPVGISFFAGAWHDAEVLALGHAYESLAR
jgi:amidase